LPLTTIGAELLLMKPCVTPERRHLLFVGDGSFQLTAQELSTMLRHDCKPVIFRI
jgi:TPP-dependent 2-oxoacid decarboxylase